MLCEMQSVSSRIWTRITVSISYDNNHYTTGTSRIRNIRASGMTWWWWYFSKYSEENIEIEFSVLTFWCLLWSTGIFSFFDHLISFLLAPNFRYSWWEQPMSFITFNNRLPSWMIFTILLLVSVDSSFFGSMFPFIGYAQQVVEVCKNCLFN